MSEPTTAADYDRTDYNQCDTLRVRLDMLDTAFDRVSLTGTVTSTGLLSGVLTLDCGDEFTVKVYDDGRADVIDHRSPSRDDADLIDIRRLD